MIEDETHLLGADCIPERDHPLGIALVRIRSTLQEMASDLCLSRLQCQHQRRPFGRSASRVWIDALIQKYQDASYVCSPRRNAEFECRGGFHVVRSTIEHLRRLSSHPPLRL